MGQVKVLLVEDEKKIADNLSKGLRKLDFHVETAYDGKIALRMFDSFVFNLVITGINLPGINGYDLCRMIRKKNQYVPIIILTSFSSTDDKIEGFDAGADDYLVKPFEFKELLFRIRVLLKRTMDSPLPMNNLLKMSNLELNTYSKEVTRNGLEVNLTLKEFQLLEYFMRNPNRVISRADIAENVWGINFDTKTNVIDVYVNFLRKKIDRYFEPKLIHTVVGMGYMLKEK